MKTLKDFTIHPSAALFPLLSEKEFGGLVDSIRSIGLLEPIVIDGKKLIDGRNRLTEEFFI
ncbi:MAG: ParB N-terminal domain-containing protein [Verrucomicrobiia bacterium]